MKLKKVLILVFLTILTITSFLVGTVNAATDSSWSSVKKAGVLRVGLTGDYAPWQTTTANGKLGGYDVAVAKLVAKDLGVKVKFVPGQFAGLIPALNNGKFDVLFGALQATPARKKALLLSKPYAADGTIAVVKKSNTKISSLKDIKGQTVGAGSGTSYLKDAQQIGGYKSIKEYKAPNDAFKDLKLGRINVISTGIVAAKNYIKTAKDGKDYKIVGKAYHKYDIDLAVKKGNTTLSKKINKAIAKETKNGNITKLQKKYLGVTSESLN